MRLIFLKIVSVMLLFIIATLEISAATVTIRDGGLEYTLDTETNTAEVYGLLSPSAKKINLVIPDYVNYNGAQIPVTSIRNQAFWNKKGLTGSLTIGNNIQIIGESAFSSCSGFTGDLTIGNNVQIIGESAFSSCSGFTGDLIIPNSVQIIGESAFSSCSGFTGDLIIPNSVQTIGSGAFYNCSGFTGNLIIPNRVQSIGAIAFYSCSGFTGDLIIPNSVQTIGELAFSFCSGITGPLTIGNSVNTIEDGAFSRCNFEYVQSLAITPPQCVYHRDYNVFSDSSYSKPLYVPAQSIDAYKQATEWKKFYSINPIENTVNISVTPTTATVEVGKTVTLTATVTPENATNKSITWTSSNTSIAVVNPDGTVIGVSEGVTVITASCGEASAFCNVTVKPVNEITAETPTQLLIKGDGTSHTFIVMMDTTNEALEVAGYKYVFGYDTSDGKSEVIANTSNRYAHTISEIFYDPNNDFWAFAYYIDPTGEYCVSGRRYLDGRVDTDFDPLALISLSTRTPVEEIIGVYTMDGHYVGKKPSRLAPGIYILRKGEQDHKIIIR